MMDHNKGKFAPTKMGIIATIGFLSLPWFAMCEEHGGEAIPEISVKSERLRRDIHLLTSINPPRNEENPSSLKKAAIYIAGEFEKTGGEVTFQYFPGKYMVFRNVICSFGPADAERIIIGAHYDVCGNQPGADDNASGVAGLLEIARLIAELKPELKYRIDLVAYANEEPPSFRTPYMGSAVHARSLVNATANVRAMISLDMLGYFSDKPRSQRFPLFFLRWFYPRKANFIAVVGKWGQGRFVRNFRNRMRSACDIGVESISAPTIIPGIDFSDHLNYWNQGWNALMITNTAFYRNPNYHRKSDTLETLDFDRMASVVKGVYWAAVNLE